MKVTDDKILKISLVTSLIGIIGLIVFTPYIEVKEVEIKDINRGMIDEEVAVCGIVDEVKKSSSGSTYFLTVNDGTGIINVIVFEKIASQMEDSSMSIDMFKNRTAKIVGTITQYNSEMELILSDESSLSIA